MPCLAAPQGPGSVAHLLKAQGLVQSLEVGMGEEVRLGRGWMFWRVHISLSTAGEDAVEHVVASVFRAIQVKEGFCQGCTSFYTGGATEHELWMQCTLRAIWQHDAAVKSQRLCMCCT